MMQVTDSQVCTEHIQARPTTTLVYVTSGCLGSRLEREGVSSTCKRERGREPRERETGREADGKKERGRGRGRKGTSNLQHMMVLDTERQHTSIVSNLRLSASLSLP